MRTSDIETILGRDYLIITRAQADELEHLRFNSFDGIIDANTCEHEAYNFIFSEELQSQRNANKIYGVIKDMNFHGERGSMGTTWIANHSKKTLSYDGLRSLRLAEQLKYMHSANPPLLGASEFRDLVIHLSKYYGVFYYRPDNKILNEEYEAAKKTIELYEKQLLTDRKKREPKLGDMVVCTSGCIGRYIGFDRFGDRYAILKSDTTKKISKDLVDMDVAWENKHCFPLPTDTDLLNFLRDNKD